MVPLNQKQGPNCNADWIVGSGNFPFSEPRPQRGFFSLASNYAIVLGFAAIVWYFTGIMRDNLIRSKVEDGIGLAKPVRDAVEKAFIEKGPGDMALQVASALAPPPPNNVQSVLIARDGAITIRFTDKIAVANENQIQIIPVVAGKAIDLSDAVNRGRKFQWECGGAAGKTTVQKKYRPPLCGG